MARQSSYLNRRYYVFVHADTNGSISKPKYGQMMPYKK